MLTTSDDVIDGALRSWPLRTPSVVCDDVELFAAARLCDDVDLSETCAGPIQASATAVASDCAYVAGDPINLRDPLGLAASGTDAGTCPQGSQACAKDTAEKPWWQGLLDLVGSLNPLQPGGASFDPDPYVKSALKFVFEGAPSEVQGAAAGLFGAATSLLEAFASAAGIAFPVFGPPVPRIDPTLSVTDQFRSLNPFGGVQRSFEAAANAEGDATIDRFYSVGRGVAGSAQLVVGGGALGRGLGARPPPLGRAGAGSANHRITDINPSGSKTNCANCVIAMDATLAGRPAVALPGKQTFPAVLEKHFGGKFVPATHSLIETHLRAAVGNRGVVYGVRADNTAHYFNAVNQGGQVKYLDAQAGTVSAGASAFSEYQHVFFMITTSQQP